MTLTAIAHEFGRSDKEIAYSISLTLAFRPVGAFVFGLLADRYGRRLPLMLDLVFFSLVRSEEHTSELQSRLHLVCRLLLEKKKKAPVRRIKCFVCASPPGRLAIPRKLTPSRYTLTR